MTLRPSSKRVLLLVLRYTGWAVGTLCLLLAAYSFKLAFWSALPLPTGMPAIWISVTFLVAAAACFMTSIWCGRQVFSSSKKSNV